MVISTLFTRRFSIWWFFPGRIGVVLRANLLCLFDAFAYCMVSGTGVTEVA